MKECNHVSGVQGWSGGRASGRAGPRRVARHETQPGLRVVTGDERAVAVVDGGPAEQARPRTSLPPSGRRRRRRPVAVVRAPPTAGAGRVLSRPHTRWSAAVPGSHSPGDARLREHQAGTTVPHRGPLPDAAQEAGDGGDAHDALARRFHLGRLRRAGGAQQRDLRRVLVHRPPPGVRPRRQRSARAEAAAGAGRTCPRRPGPRRGGPGAGVVPVRAQGRAPPAGGRAAVVALPDPAGNELCVLPARS
ncbi:MAG: hypothetical protein JWN08_904 [Frankiales bacterium]|nr:hypothetical protein [Frankiales bacterium]